jgi:hypothetical protein
MPTEPSAGRRLRKGDVVSLYRIDPTSFAPFIEGRGVIEGPYRWPHYFYVRLDGEKVCRVRFVHPDWQENPERCLALLRAFWEANLAPPAIDEFFPASASKRGVP